MTVWDTLGHFGDRLEQVGDRLGHVRARLERVGARFFAAFRILALLLPGLLWACHPAPPKQPHRVAMAKPVKTAYTPQDFLTHLALAQLALRQSDDTPDAMEDLDILQAYARQSPKPAHRTVLVLDYKINGASHQLLAPVEQGARGGQKALYAIMRQLAAMPHTLYNLRLVVVDVAPGAVAFDTLDDADAVRKTVDDVQDALLLTAEALPAATEARTQLQLADFFMADRRQDAAYLMVDNAKNTLAAAARHHAIDTETLRRLSKELEIIEGRLHETLPYNL